MTGLITCGLLAGIPINPLEASATTENFREVTFRFTSQFNAEIPTSPDRQAHDRGDIRNNSVHTGDKILQSLGVNQPQEKVVQQTNSLFALIYEKETGHMSDFPLAVCSSLHFITEAQDVFYEADGSEHHIKRPQSENEILKTKSSNRPEVICDGKRFSYSVKNGDITVLQDDVPYYTISLTTGNYRVNGEFLTVPQTN
jgi:hypothetical protein